MLTEKHGDWIYVEERAAIHVIPVFGPKHRCTYACWCHPVMDVEDPDVVVHNVAH